MIPLVFLLALHVVAVKVFKKTSPNGKLTVYLGSRDFVDRLDGNVDPIDGLLVVDTEYLKDRRIYGQVSTTFRYGEDEGLMGLKFSKEMVLCKEQVVPSNKTNQLTPLQEKLIKKLGENNNVFPFTFHFPTNAPPSVTLQQDPSETGSSSPLGVEYQLRAFVASNEEDPGHRRSAVSLRIRKVQFAELKRGQKQPSTSVTKGFTLSPGKICLEVTLGKDLYYHQEEISAQVKVSNTSKKAVKNIKVMVVQHCEITMVNAHFSRQVAHLETREGCPITPGASLTKVFALSPSARNCKEKRGIALDGNLKDSDVNLASSTLIPGNANDALGFVVSYSVRVKLNLGTLGGELQADLPFKLVHPSPDGSETAKESNKLQSSDRSKYEKQCYANDADEEDDNIIFEDFAKLRMSASEIDN